MLIGCWNDGGGSRRHAARNVEAWPDRLGPTAGLMCGTKTDITELAITLKCALWRLPDSESTLATYKSSVLLMLLTDGDFNAHRERCTIIRLLYNNDD